MCSVAVACIVVLACGACVRGMYSGGVASEDWTISCLVESNWFIHESDDGNQTDFDLSCSF